MSEPNIRGIYLSGIKERSFYDNEAAEDGLEAVYEAGLRAGKNGAEPKEVVADLPIHFGTLNGDCVGKGTLEVFEKNTIVTIEIDHENRETIVDLLKYQLVGFAVVLRPGNPSPKND